jgi:uncharacterized protein (TIGR03437 family)
MASSTPLPTSLGGVTVTITDSRNVTHTAPLFFVAQGQVNFQVPAAVAAGRAALTLRKSNGSMLSGDLLVDAVGPGMFSANATGEGVGLIAAVRVDAAGAQTTAPAFAYDAAQQKSVAAPISLGAETDKVYLVVYATGIRGVQSLSDISAQVGDVDIPVLHAGSQGEFIGIDQVNLGPLPRSLAGKGVVEVELTVARRRANRVTVTIQ